MCVVSIELERNFSLALYIPYSCVYTCVYVYVCVCVCVCSFVH